MKIAKVQPGQGRELEKCRPWELYFIIDAPYFAKYLVPAREEVKNTSPYPKFDVQLLDSDVGSVFKTSRGDTWKLRAGEAGILIKSPEPKYVRDFWAKVDELAKRDGVSVGRY